MASLLSVLIHVLGWSSRATWATPLDYSQGMTTGTFLPLCLHLHLHLQLHIPPLPTRPFQARAKRQLQVQVQLLLAAQVTVCKTTLVQGSVLYSSLGLALAYQRALSTLGSIRPFPHISRLSPALPSARSKTSIHHDTSQHPRLLERPVECIVLVTSVCSSYPSSITPSIAIIQRVVLSCLFSSHLVSSRLARPQHCRLDSSSSVNRSRALPPTRP